MIERSHPIARVLERARDEAAVLGSKDLEAEHLLLALARDEDPVVREVLAGAGLDRDTLRRMLEAQDEAALAGVGVSRAAFGLPPARPLTRSPGWGTSSKQAIMRGRAAVGRGEGRMQAGHLLLGVLRAESGTVPRALALAGADQTELATRTQAALRAAPSPAS